MSTLRRLARERVGGVTLLLGLTLCRLLTTLGRSPAVATELYLLAVTGIVLTWCLQVLAGTETRARLRASAYGRRRLEDRPQRLVALEESVPYWIEVAGLRHYRLRPEVATVAAERLTRLGIDLRSDPRAAAVLGPAVWDLVRLNVPPPADEQGAGLTPAQVEEIIATLEALERPDVVVPLSTGDK